MSKRKAGFTLTELFVVIGIVAVVAAILFPVLMQARETARHKECADNMKLLTLGMLQYVADNDQTMPERVFASAESPPGYPNIYAGPQTGSTTWAFVIYPYVRVPSAYVCPEDPTHPINTISGYCGEERGIYTNILCGNTDVPHTYAPITQFHEQPSEVTAAAQNSACMLLGHAGEVPLDPEITMGSIPQPGRTIWLGESGVNRNWCCSTPPGQCWNNPCEDIVAESLNNNAGFQVEQRAGNLVQPTYENTSLGDYHNGGDNWAFEDGHVKWYTTAETIDTAHPLKDLWLRIKY